MKNFFWMIFTILTSLTLVFICVRLAPGDPVENILGPLATSEEIVSLRNKLGLDQTIWTQYRLYLKSFFQGDLGNSVYSGKPVFELIKSHLAPTLIISFFAILFSSIIGSFLGVISAIKKHTFSDKLIRYLSLLGISFPIFSLGPILILIFSIQFNLLPVSEWGHWTNAILPILTLTIPLSTILIRVARNRFLEEQNELWVLVLHSKGMPLASVHSRVFYSILTSLLTVLSLQLTVVLSGTIITETIFDIPGIGKLLFEGLQNRDYPLVQGVIVYTTLVYLGVQFLTDFLSSKIDPRIN
jgi:peptide/nickel transport system permease protein